MLIYISETTLCMEINPAFKLLETPVTSNVDLKYRSHLVLWFCHVPQHQIFMHATLEWLGHEYAFRFVAVWSAACDSVSIQSVVKIDVSP